MTTSTIEGVSAATQAETTGNKPVKVFRHRNLSASVFANKAKNGGIFQTVSLQRTYKVGDEFKHSNSFTRDELPVAQHLLHQAWAFMLDADARAKDAS